jgi:2,4-dienoyl-CoA reductase-like NADH-dependent reductase (Old Yellow Enzyme family)
MPYDVLFEPVRIGSLELKNRIAVAPMNMGYTGPLGYPSEDSLAYYSTRARGGFGLIITEASMINPHPWYGGEGLNVAHFTDNRFFRFWSKIVQSVHSYAGCRICIQLSPGWGRQGHPHVGTPDIPPAAPSVTQLHIDLRDYFRNKGWYKQATKGVPAEVIEAMKVPDLIRMTDEQYYAEDFQNALKEGICKLDPDLYREIWWDIPRELTIAEIEELEDRMAKRAKDAFRIGFDAVEIHSPHGYLLHQFLSPLCNKRRDRYGGSLENRARFLVNIVRKIRDEVGPDKPLWCRLSGDELLPGGITHAEQCEVAALCKEAGVDAIHVSQGSYATPGRTFAYDGEDDFTKWAKGFKDATNLPIIVPNFMTAGCAERAIREKSVDIVSLGRQSIADPFWPAKVRAGREKDIVKCTRCQQCYFYFTHSWWLTCSVNPTAGREKHFPEIWLKGSSIEKRGKKFIRTLKDLPQV